MVTKENKDTISAQRFLEQGERGKLPAARLAEACNQLIRQQVQASTVDGLKLANQFLELAKDDDGELLTMAWRSLGWANIVAANYPQAEQAYIKARKRLTHDALVRSRIDRILIDVYMYLGDNTSAQRCAKRAMATFRKLGAGDDLAKTQVNYANLLHRQDRHRQARRLYDQAGQFFHRQGNEVATALCYYNLANTMVQLFDFKEARTKYEYAYDRFEHHGFELYAVDCQNGLSWLHMLQGDYHLALKGLAKCEEGYRRIGQPRGVVLCLLDRAEAFLGLNLFADAEQAARDALKCAHPLKIDYEKAKARFFLAQALYGSGRNQASRNALKAATTGFEQAHNDAFQAAAKLFGTRLTDSRQRRHNIEAARRNFSQAQLPLWEAICDIQRLTIDPDNTPALKRLKRNVAAKTVPHLIAERETILGDRAACDGRQRLAIKHWQCAANTLDSVRAKLPPIELRTAFTRLRTGPYHKLVKAELANNPKAAAVWSERYRTAGVWATPQTLLRDDPQRQKATESLRLLAERITHLAGRIDYGGGHRAIGSSSLPELGHLQKNVRDSLADLNNGSSNGSMSLSWLEHQFEAASKRLPIVQFHEDGTDLIAFIHDTNGCRAHVYASGVKTLSGLIARWRFTVSQRTYGQPNPGKPELAMEKSLLAELGEQLWRPLGISSRSRRVLLLPDGDLYNLPWIAMIVDGIPLIERHQIILAPSLRHYILAQSRKVRSSKKLIFVGRTDGLTHIDSELKAIMSCTDDSLAVNNHCCRDDIPESGTAGLWHFTGHATLRLDNPFYSALEMIDGPLFAADFRLRQVSVGLVMLAGCRTGQESGLPGEESSGLVRSLLEMGARNVVASHWAVTDQSAALWTSKFYNHYFANLPAAEAARQAAIDVREEYPSACHWAAFSTFGAGE